MMIDTTLGPLEEKYLRRLESVTENGNERTHVTEYYFMDKCVHRSVHVHLKQGLAALMQQAHL